jgi:protein-tyrosine phosphatase
MPEILDWRTAADQRCVVRHAAEVLADGGLVAFPTETVYGIAAHALVPGAVERLALSKGRAEDKPLALAVGGPAEALDWLPALSPLGRRLARRCWPGPVTLVCGDGLEDGLAGRLPEAVRRRICPAGTVGLRSPAHAAILGVLPRLPGPLVLTSANRSGEPEATTAEEVVDALGGDLDLVIADGPSRYGQPSTVVRVAGKTWSVLREGVVAASVLERLAGCMIVFVCTGNTCRSPLAEALCKKLLAERLGCVPAELPQRGYTVVSAGLSALGGGRAAAEAIEAARELGADLDCHTSRPMTADLAAQADLLVAMTRGHLLALADYFPESAGQQPSARRLLCPEGTDVPDPIGCDRPVYRECAHLILGHVERLLPEVLQP